VLSTIADRVAVFYAGRIVESGETRDVLGHPRHPYTRALLDALPHPEDEGGTELRAIPGQPATPRTRPAGCAFHPRCAYAQETCRVQVPPLVPIGSGRRLACPPDPFAGQ
jgi:oligopeptide/dipeptide ABC transporter ATP-binding protein